LEKVLAKYLPQNSIEPVIELIKAYHVHLKIVNERKTRHGDYRKNMDGSHQITVNASLNQYRFLITLVHEIAHLVAFQKYGRNIKPHGDEWKHTFKLLMVPFLNTLIFPKEILPVVVNHFKNPAASSDTDAMLSMVLQRFEDKEQKIFLNDVPLGGHFMLNNHRIYRKERLIVKRFECTEVRSGRKYAIKPNAIVYPVKQ